MSSPTVVFEEFSPKDPAEVLILSMDFTNLLGTEAITSCTWACTVQSGADASASAMISGATDISGTPIVKQKVINGVNGVVYYLTATAVTNSTPARTLVGTGILRCITGA